VAKLAKINFCVEGAHPIRKWDGLSTRKGVKIFSGEPKRVEVF
jgi:hypothetical protein